MSGVKDALALDNEAVTTPRLSPRLSIQLLTAAVGLPLFGAVIFGPPWIFAALMAGTACLALWELTDLVGAAPNPAAHGARFSDPRLLRVIAVVWGLVLFAGVVGQVSAASWMLTLSGLCISAALVGLWSVRPPSRAVGAVGAVLGSLPYVVLPLAFLTLVRFDAGPGWVVLAIGVNWFGDAGASLVGRRIGRRPLASAISPNKTIEGALAGLVIGVLVAFAVRAALLPELAVWQCLVIAVPMNFLGQMGDLVESLIKRSAQTKDSGSMFPGYGGVLDKIDSLLFGVPWLYACLLVFAPPGTGLAP